MMYQTIFDNIYNRIAETPDFPQSKVTQLIEALPPFSINLPALIYLLPWGSEIQKETEMNAAALTAITLSIFIHDDANHNRAFTTKEAVLNGDFLFALTFSLLPAAAIKEIASDFVKAYGRFNEEHSSHMSGKTKELPEQTALSFAQKDYGRLLSDIALISAKEAKKTETEQAAFAEIASDIGTLWGLRLEGYSMAVDGLLAKIEKNIASLPWTECLLPLLQSMK